MPKMKTKSGAAKRFKVRAGGGIKRSQAFKRHILTKKTTKSKRQLRGMTDVHPADQKLIRAMLPTLDSGVKMPRVKRGVTARARHKKVLDQARVTGAVARTIPDRQAGGHEGRSVPVS